MHAKGLGVNRSSEDAARYYTQAADRGSNQALNGLGFLAAQELNYTAARGFFERAAERGDLDATFNLAVMSYSGLGQEKNLT